MVHPDSELRLSPGPLLRRLLQRQPLSVLWLNGASSAARAFSRQLQERQRPGTGTRCCWRYREWESGAPGPFFSWQACGAEEVEQCRLYMGAVLGRRSPGWQVLVVHRSMAGASALPMRSLTPMQKKGRRSLRV